MSQSLLDNSNRMSVEQRELAARNSLAGDSVKQPHHREYVCPGEAHPISHSIHLARLASSYSKCGECVHRHEVGSRPLPLSSPLREANHRVARRSFVATDGVRGIYLNELDRTRAAQWGAALAAMLWDEEPRYGTARRSESDSVGTEIEACGGGGFAPQIVGWAAPTTVTEELVGTAHPTSWEPPYWVGKASGGRNIEPSDKSPIAPPSAGDGEEIDLSHTVQAGSPAFRKAGLPESDVERRGPVVVIGFDERPASPDIVTGVALGLRRMGCQVIDLGQTTATCFQFATRHLDAAAGMFVTGAGCDPSWTGFDVVGRHAQPWSRGGRLDELEVRTQADVLRPTRAAGSQRTFPALASYEDELAPHFHALRPLHVVCGSATRLFPRTLDRLFAKLPCRVTHVSLPTRQRDLADPNDADVRRVAAAVTSGGQHLGLIVDDDGQRCACVTERGRLVTSGELARVLIDFERREQRDLKVVVDRSLSDELTGWLTPRRIEYGQSESTAAAVVETLAKSDSRLGLLGDGRIWFRDTQATCDAILTLARTLQALSLSDASFSEVVRAASVESFVA